MPLKFTTGPYPVSRRAALATLSVGGLSLWSAPFGDARLLAAATRQAASAKSIIFLALYGGPPHQDTFDIKENAPSEIRGEFASIATSLSGLRVCEYMPKLAKLAQLYTVIRSVTHEDNAHESAFYSLMTGWPHPQPNTNARPAPTDYPVYGTVLDYLKPPADPVPGFVLTGGVTSTGIGQNAGFFGRGRAPFVLKSDANEPDFGVPELSLQDELSLPRLTSRRDLLGRLDDLTRSIDREPSSRFSSVQLRAFEMLTQGNLRAAFNINAEPPHRRDAYGRHPFGQNLLLARRLVEAGVPVVQVNWRNRGDGGLDTHYDNFNMCKGNLLPKLDGCLSALLIDLEERGLLDQTLVVAAGEFGRTPRINPDAGRDHWAGCNSILLAGGGIQRGYVFGSSNRTGAYPATNPVGPWDVYATMLHCYGIDPTSVVRDAQGRPHPVCHGAVIEPVLAQSSSREPDSLPRPPVSAVIVTVEIESTVPTAPPEPLSSPRLRANAVDAATLIFIPGGVFTMGSDDFSIERPPHRVRLRPFWIARTPVTNAMYRKFRSDTGHRPAEFTNMHLMDPKLCDDDEQPVVGVDHADAIAYCKWAGGRLPTEAEWELAARGADGRRYPWGNQDPQPGQAVYGLTVGRGGKAAPAGTTPGDVSPFGVLDMAGNVLEWCADWFAAYPAANSEPLDNPTGPSQGSQRIMRGGCWAYEAPSLRTTERILAPAHARLNLAGFRIAMDCAPGDLS